MLDLTPLVTKDYFEMPENIRRKEYFLNWHKYLCLKIDEAIAKVDIKLGGAAYAEAQSVKREGRKGCTPVD